MAEVEARNIRELVVFNKCDLVDQTQAMALRGMEPGSLLVSARTGEGIDELLRKIEELLPRPDVLVRVLIPYSRGDLVSRIHTEGKINSLEHVESGTKVTALVKPQLANELAKYSLDAS